MVKHRIFLNLESQSQDSCKKHQTHKNCMELLLWDLTRAAFTAALLHLTFQSYSYGIIICESGVVWKFMDMEKLSQFPFMFMICHFSYEKNIIWGETREIPRNQTHPNSDQNIGWKMRKKNMQLACIGLLMLGLFNSPLWSYYPLVMTNIAMVKITMLLSSVNHQFLFIAMGPCSITSGDIGL